MNQLGYYGKTPHRGDFVRFNLPQTFLKVWDDWLLQVMIHGESHSSDWPDIYACAPSWRFALSSGIAGNTPWIGVLKPSEDKVGRRFPFCLARSLAEGATPCVSISTQALWLDEADALLGRLSTSDYDYDELQNELSAMAARFRADKAEVPSPISLASPVDIITISTLSTDALCSNDTLSVILDTVLRQTLGEYSVWITNETSNTTVINAGLPVDNAGLALFNSDWETASSVQIDFSTLSRMVEPVMFQPETTVDSASGRTPAQKIADELVDTHLSENDPGSRERPHRVAPEALVNEACEQIPSADDWAALDVFSDTSLIADKLIVPEVEPLELDEDDAPDAPWEN